MIITELSLDYDIMDDDDLRRVISGIHIHTCGEFLAGCKLSGLITFLPTVGSGSLR